MPEEPKGTSCLERRVEIPTQPTQPRERGPYVGLLVAQPLERLTLVMATQVRLGVADDVTEMLRMPLAHGLMLTDGDQLLGGVLPHTAFSDGDAPPATMPGPSPSLASSKASGHPRPRSPSPAEPTGLRALRPAEPDCVRTSPPPVP